MKRALVNVLKCGWLPALGILLTLGAIYNSKLILVGMICVLGLMILGLLGHLGMILYDYAITELRGVANEKDY